jgi:acetolactate synthase I/II/III large subunit
VLGNGLIGTMEAYLSSSPMLLLTDFSDATPFHLHAPYQQATGDYGSWDARRAFGGVTKQVMQAHTPVAAVQATQLAIKHATAGQPGPVTVLFSMESLTGQVEPDSQPVLYPTRYYLTPRPTSGRQCARRCCREGIVGGETASGHCRQWRAHRTGL